MDVKRKKCGFTLVELLTSLAIVAMLVGLLVPALSLVRKITKETKQKAQLTTIGLALATFKNDYDGEYPPSDWRPDPLRRQYCGAQKLAEALLGWDLLGFHPKSDWRADGRDRNDAEFTYDPLKTRDVDPQDGVPDTLNERRGAYLELATTNAFRLGLGISPARQQDPEGLFNDTRPLNPDTYVICDVFGVKKIKIGQRAVKAGTPILYYKANTSSKAFERPARVDQRIYNALDNQRLLELGTVTKDGAPGKPHPLAYNVGIEYPVFYDDQSNYGAGIGYGIRDPKITARDWPYRPDSYILISAGADGEYGTDDDIRNFGN